MNTYMTLEGAVDRARELSRRNTRDYYIAQPCNTKLQKYRVMTRLQYLKGNVLPYRLMVTPEGQVVSGAGYPPYFHTLNGR